MNWHYRDIFNLFSLLLKSAEVTRKRKLFNKIVSIWSFWKDSFKEIIAEEGTSDDLKLLNNLQNLINNHYKK